MLTRNIFTMSSFQIVVKYFCNPDFSIKNICCHYESKPLNPGAYFEFSDRALTCH